MHYRDLKTWFHEQEARNLPLHEAQPSAVLIIEFSIRERVLVNRNNKPTKSALAVRRQRFKQLEGKKTRRRVQKSTESRKNISMFRTRELQ